MFYKRVQEVDTATNPLKVKLYKKLVSYTASKKLVGYRMSSWCASLPSIIVDLINLTVCVFKCFSAILDLNLVGNNTGNKSGFCNKQLIRYKTLSKLLLRNLTPSVKE